MDPLESARNVSRDPVILAMFLIVGIIRPLHFTSYRAIRPAHAWSSPEVCYVDNIWSCIKVLYNPKGLAVLITTGLDVISLIPDHSVSPCFSSITHTHTQSFTETQPSSHTVGKRLCWNHCGGGFVPCRVTDTQERPTLSQAMDGFSSGPQCP